MSRGRPDSFSWSDVKIDKHRENYLGHSLNAPVGRWQKGKDILWYARKTGPRANGTPKVAAQSDESLLLAKEKDRQAIMERLGMVHKKRKIKNRLNETEMKELMRRGDIERDDTQAAERIDGLGASSARYHDGRSKAERVAKLKNMIAKGMKTAEEGEGENESDGFAKPMTKVSASQMLEMAKAALKKAEEESSDEDDEESRKAKKKAKKAAKKAKKKAKKEAKKAKKKAKKEARKRRRHDSDSD
mmetsp:Transcript_9325/g.22975  ORF Transcript_9325/g.22975 Transcript_9325/m.22975 type:complete len:245 (-) Transcript_9325:214-948(-)|eukprot:CAMPEP_0114522326 /NCGR_PEP_ID=MMETSP0109-20121206/20681_1 /TAXON_ID=29199 /ORGANISM="Chlorarachnion reptans, Strain CCCM449" /LENGTH=244 /DNA_ID=CAMNT_0001703533 /DNA_START=142 /DNA_END=876 /DNA_ORIENTATION=-